MNNNKLHGYWERCSGFARELWGEVRGDESIFADGLRRRMIGRVESFQGMSHRDAAQQVDQLIADDSGVNDTGDNDTGDNDSGTNDSGANSSTIAETKVGKTRGHEH